MIKDKVSVIIPSHKEIFLQKTIDGILGSAEGDIEIMVCLDYEDPIDPIVISDENKVKVLQTPKKVGMRKCINIAANLADGEFIMKSDAHCKFDKGFDTKLKANCLENWVVVPRRYALDAEKWARKRTDNFVDYIYIYPPNANEEKRMWLKGKKWLGKNGDNGDLMYLENDRKDILIDGILGFQGSCWFMRLTHFHNIGCLDGIKFGSSGREASEICFKTWLSGGMVVRNKNTWYAHLSQGKKYRVSRGFKQNQQAKSADYLVKLCFGNWPGKIKDMEWLINKFRPMGLWPDGWFSEEEIRVFTNDQ
jgi:hypothetical protein